jgi:murein DD-endopeptidase MepM/ murein hydrolase activator NlpD
VRRAACAVVAGLSLGAAAAAEEHCHHGVCVSWQNDAAGAELALANPLRAPILVRLELYDLDNVEVTSPGSALTLVAAGERRPLAALRRQDPGRRFTWHFRWRYWIGDPAAAHDPGARYRMPFGGAAPRELSQGTNGKYSHRGTHAFDFLLPVGTPVLAARPGVVARVVDEYERGGARKSLRGKGNEVMVLHADGSLARYAHLRRGAAVSVGDEVAAGALLGRSGTTGFSTTPHLHFEVFTAAPDGGRTTQPIRFESASPDGFEPIAGSFYPPQ